MVKAHTRPDGHKWVGFWKAPGSHIAQPISENVEHRKAPERKTGVSQTVTMYTTTWCGHCFRLKRELDEAGIQVSMVDVDEHRHHSDRIIAATGGYRVVPTIEVAGRLLVNPSLDEVRAALASA